MSPDSILSSRKKPNAIHLFGSKVANASRADVARFLTHQVPDHYRALARGHERFVVEGGGAVRQGATIDCRERAGNQEVHHRYRVTALDEGHIAYASSPSKTFVHLKDRVIEGESRTFVDYDLEALEGHRTRVSVTIVIQLESAPKKWIALAAGSRGLWQKHLEEELGNLVRLVSPLEAIGN